MFSHRLLAWCIGSMGKTNLLNPPTNVTVIATLDDVCSRNSILPSNVEVEFIVMPPIRCQQSKLSKVETVGVVVSKERTGDYLKFVVDDGTGCIPCILDVTDRSHLGLAAEVETEIALREAATVELGKLVRVRGMIMLGEEDGLHAS
ncbi:hypothetical protein ZIOFF_023355 [Zingiber officinale]|uniref:CST complex subunit STN1 n=1 Tax=Zingiber officinale TaxID=94328 RepID=A0A8J5LIG1_ZINOF|nr:hypothetical protein ZIOFF_023355 [Zingiber officinale]